jgi:hypothetical protein
MNVASALASGFVTTVAVVFIGLCLVSLGNAIWAPISDGSDDKRHSSYDNDYKFFVNAWLYDQGYRFTLTRDQQRHKDELRRKRREDNARRKGIL